MSPSDALQRWLGQPTLQPWPSHLRWRSEAGLPAPVALETLKTPMPVDAIYEQLAEGRHLLWQGDWVKGRHLMTALSQRADQRILRARAPRARTPAEAFAQHRIKQGQRAALLARLLVVVDADYRLPLKRAQIVEPACREVWGAPDGTAQLLALRELLAIISAHEWRKKGVPVPAVQGRIHPHYGVFSPVRGEYVQLVAEAPLPTPCSKAFDIGTGSGILAALLARRGIPSVIATDLAPRALACAAENLEKLGLTGQVSLSATDLFPTGKADLIVCNPPWLPAQPTSPVEQAVYDPDSRMLRGFLAGLAEHLTARGEGWLILSDLAEHLGLRRRDELLDWIGAAGLRVLGRHDTRPTHAKATDRQDPLHAARAAEITSLWRLGHTH